MKKVISAVLCFVLLFSMFQATAEASEMSTAERVTEAFRKRRENASQSTEPTKTRALVEFCELAMKRIGEFEDLTGIDCSFYILPESIEYNQSIQSYVCTSAFGTVFANKSDFSVDSMLMLLVDDSFSAEETQENLYKCVAAFSALEYSDEEDGLMNIVGRLDPSQDSSSIAKAYKIFGDEIIENSKQRLGEASYKLGDDVLVYSGNYDYYACGRDMDGSEVIFLTAKKR